MILQCDQCNTKFRLDDSKMKPGGVKVRCSKCRHVFLAGAEPEPKQEDSDFEALLAGLGAPAAEKAAEPAAAENAFDFEEPAPAAPAAAAEKPAAPAPESEIGDFGDFDFGAEPAPPLTASAATPATDFDDFDFPAAG